VKQQVLLTLSAARRLRYRHDDAVECPFGVFHPTDVALFPLRPLHGESDATAAAIASCGNTLFPQNISPFKPDTTSRKQASKQPVYQPERYDRRKTPPSKPCQTCI
jgi:hypothetical protein